MTWNPHPDAPAGGGTAAASTPPAGSSGAEWRKKVKAALAAQGKARRRGRFTRAAKRTGPGMIRKPPPEPEATT